MALVWFSQNGKGPFFLFHMRIKGFADEFSFPTTYADLLVLHIHLGAANRNLLTNSYRQCRTAGIVAWHCHGVKECLLYLCRDASFEQAHGVLHGCCITRECDTSIVREAKFLLGHP